LFQAQHSTSVWTHTFRLNTATFVQRLRTCRKARAPHFVQVVNVLLDRRTASERLVSREDLPRGEQG
jgi:hypothetical protein